MNYAVISTCGKQYKVKNGDILELDNLNKNPDDKHIFDKVLLLVDGENVKIGSPYLNDISIAAKIIENLKGEKIRVSKFKAKAKYRRNTGFRQSLTKVLIESIDNKNSDKVK